ncbi:TPA: hypothetical protein I7777_05915 [Vibrio vulnificus]|nr:hypothetical protein [Vibrio vulnificus]
MKEEIKGSKVNVEMLRRLTVEAKQLKQEISAFRGTFNFYVEKLEAIDESFFDEELCRQSYLELMLTLHHDANKMALVNQKLKKCIREQLSIVSEELLKVSRREAESISEVQKQMASMKQRQHTTQKSINGLISIVATMAVVGGYFSISSPWPWLVALLHIAAIGYVYRNERKREQKSMMKLQKAKKSILHSKRYTSLMYSIQGDLLVEDAMNDLLEQQVTSILESAFAQRNRLVGKQC